MLLFDIANTSARIAQTQSRLEKAARLSECLKHLAAPEIAIGVSYLTGRLPQGRIGIGPALLQRAAPTAAAEWPSLALLEVDRVFERIAVTTGTRSGAERCRMLGSLLARATTEEQDFLIRLMLGELRQGALEGLMAEAIARAGEVPVAEVRRAIMVAGEPAAVAKAALTEGLAGLNRFALQLLQPVKPMLAQTAVDVADALQALGCAGIEYKLDGARVQVHKAGGEIRVFTRRLHDVTSAVPEVVDAVRRAAGADLILDGEVLALRPDGRPHAFQDTMRRFGRRLEVARMREQLPLHAFFFDLLHLGGRDLIACPAGERFAMLSEALPAELLIPRLVTDDAGQAGRFLEQALHSGHEGVMVKSLQAPYEAGNRGSAWLKVKPAHTLDLVVLAAEWGHGRRRGWLSNLHLGARDPATGGFVMLGKTFKGLTDEMLAWQTRALQDLAQERRGDTVHVRPELVVEVAFNDIQTSPQYPAGLALRFARVKRFRPDKTAAEADTVQSVQALHERGAGRHASAAL